MPITIPQVAAAMQRVLGPVADAAARATGCVQRASPLTGAYVVQTRVFGWLTRPDASLDRLRQTAARLGVTVTRQAIDDRFTPPAAACLARVRAATVEPVLAAAPQAIPLLARFPGGVWVQDRTVLTWPDARAAHGPGGGGRDGPGAARKLQVRWDLLHGARDGPLPQPGRAQDRASPHQDAPVPGESLTLADLGCVSVAVRRRRGEQGGFWLSRLHAGTAIFTADGRRREVVAVLAAQATATVDLAVTVGVSERLPARLLAVRVPQEVADQRRRRLYAEARTHGQAVSRQRLARCAWTVLVTTVPAERLTVREALVLARARWQIAVLFKQWKSLPQVDAWATTNPWRILCAVDAKRIGVVIQHWVMRVGRWHSPDRRLPKAVQTLQEWAAALTAAVRRGRRAVVAVLGQIVADLAQGHRLTPHRRRRATSELLLALDALEAMEATGTPDDPPWPAAPALVPAA